MISRHTGRCGLLFDVTLLAVALALPVFASAGEEFKPFDIPEEMGPLDSAPVDSSLPEFVEPAPGAPGGTTSAAETAPLPVPVDTGPPILAPPVDAYIDLSLNNSSLNNLGYGDQPGGYRFIVGMIFEQFSNARFTMAPEVGYVRIGLAEETTTTTTRNAPIPQYDNIKKEKHSIDLSTLTFGLRSGYQVTGQLEAFGRAGMHFYHGASQQQTTWSYVPVLSTTPERSDDVQPSFSTADVGTDYYLSGGLAWKIGPVPSVYAEYQVIALGGSTIATTSLGFLLNF